METLEDCRVSPPPGTVVTTDLPLTFLDIHWLAAPQVQRVFFYGLRRPSSQLRCTVVADLKDSLSITLQYFFPYASKLIFPPPPGKPYISYKDDCSVRLTVVDSDSDFVYLSGDHPRKAADIQFLVPRLTPPLSDEETGVRKQNIMEIRITLFSDSGITIGMTFLHAVADGRSFSSFMKTWAAVHRSRGKTNGIQSTLPSHDRHLIKDEKDMSSVFMKDMFCFEDIAPIPSENMRVTFKMSDAKIAMLKERVKTHNKEEGEAESLYISTFVVCVAHIWVCWTKFEDHRAHYEHDKDEICNLIFPADYRERAAFPVPAVYFGNCIIPRFVSAKKHLLVGKSGFLVAVKAIAKEVQRVREEPFVQVENWQRKVGDIVKAGRNFLTIGGSPKFRVYKTDFGWGEPKKTDCAHIVSYGSVCIDGGRDEDGGVEFGLVVDQRELDALTALFEQSYLNFP